MNYRDNEVCSHVLNLFKLMRGFVNGENSIEKVEEEMSFLHTKLPTVFHEIDFCHVPSVLKCQDSNILISYAYSAYRYKNNGDYILEFEELFSKLK